MTHHKEKTPTSDQAISGVYGEQLSFRPTPAFCPILPSVHSAAAIHGHIFKSQDRFDSKGRKIAGNGLALTGAIIRRDRKVLIDVVRYGAWLSGGGA